MNSRPSRRLLAPGRAGPLAAAMAGLLCVLTAVPGLSAQGEQRRTLRVGTWNLEQLGFREERRSDEDLAAIAAFIAGMDTAVLAVQEIGGPAALRRLCRHLGHDYDFVLGSTGTFSGNGRISIGFLYDLRRVELLDAGEMLDLPREFESQPIFHRVPVTATFRAREGGIDFRLVTVHLKAGRGERNELKRRGEVTALGHALRRMLSRPGEDEDVLLLGDFNHTYDAPAHRSLAAVDVVRYLRPRQPHATILHFEEPIDHVAAARGITEELIADSLRVHAELADTDRTAWRKTYSDHLPVTVDLDATIDRDPEATFAPVAADQRLFRGGFAAADIVATRLPGGEAFGPGTVVSIRRAGSLTEVTGTLLAAPGTWVFVRTERGTLALPADRIESMKASPAR